MYQFTAIVYVEYQRVNDLESSFGDPLLMAMGKKSNTQRKLNYVEIVRSAIRTAITSA